MNSKNNKMELLGNAPIPKALMAMGIPTMLGMMVNAIYNLVDAYFVGGLGTSQMGAISVVYPLGQVVVGLPSQDKHSGRITKNDGGGISMDKDQKHIPFAVIVAATNGDEAAIQEILDFYDGYISKLSLRKLYDKYGNVYMVVDSELKGRIQAAVMDMIANFEIIVI